MMMGVQQTIRGEVTIRNLSKSFKINGRDINVLRGIDLQIRSGESLAIVGASGSGKTTLLRVLAGLEHADSGGVLIDGQPVHGVGTERAVIFQEPRLLPWRTVIENVAFPLEIRGIGQERARSVAKRYIELVGLSAFTEALPSQLSGGMKKRLLLCRALIHDPEILILDEPTSGCDLELKFLIWDYLLQLNKEGKTIFLTTHYMEEAEKLCKTIGIINNGKIVRIGDKKQILQDKSLQDVFLEITGIE